MVVHTGGFDIEGFGDVADGDVGVAVGGEEVDGGDKEIPHGAGHTEVFSGDGWGFARHSTLYYISYWCGQQSWYNGRMRKRVGGVRKERAVRGDDVRVWRTFGFWRDLVWYFVVFSYVGHFVEMGWTWLGHVVLGNELQHNILHNGLEPYTIYGAGVVAVILLVRPLMRKFHDGVLATFVVATVVCAVLECVSSMFLVWRYGHNPYWWYSDRRFNLGGHICLANTLLFGVLATVFLKVVYPRTERWLRQGNQVVINVILGVLLVLFGAYFVMQTLAL